MKMVLNINLKYLPMKGHFFCFNAATAPIIPFLPVIGRQIGFTGTIIGIIYTVLPICGMLAKPIMGGLADRYRWKKFIFILFEVICIFAFFPINFIPKLPPLSQILTMWDGETIIVNVSSIHQRELIDQLMHEAKTCICEMWCSLGSETSNDPARLFKVIITIDLEKVTITNDSLYLPFKKFINRNNAQLHLCNYDCTSIILNEIFGNSNKEKTRVIVRYYQFWIFFLLAICAWTSMAVIISIGDAICFELLEGDVYLYGRQRMWDSIASGSFSIFAGLLVDEFSKNKLYKDYTSIFLLMLVMMILDLIWSTKLKTNQQFISSSIAKEVIKLLRHLRILVFMIWCMLIGMCTALIVNYLFWYIEDLSKKYDHTETRVKTLQGLVMGIQCLAGELPFFFVSGWILKRLGHIHCMTLVLFCVAVRFLLYTLMVNPWWILPIEISNGITYGLFYATMVSYASIVAPPGAEATIQGLVGAIYEGVGISLGSLIGGLLLDQYGAAKMYLVFSICAFIGGILHIIVQLFIKKYSSNEDTNLDNRNTQVDVVDEN